MIKIGAFAKICNVSTQTLRYYDSVGILKADEIDPSSGYRFYSIDAVEKYKRITEVKKSLYRLPRMLQRAKFQILKVNLPFLQQKPIPLQIWKSWKMQTA